MAGGTQRHGRNKKKCERYRAEGRREKNKARRKARAERRAKRLKERTELKWEGLTLGTGPFAHLKEPDDAMRKQRRRKEKRA